MSTPANPVPSSRATEGHETMSREEIEAIRARCEAAIMGPWVVRSEPNPVNDAGRQEIGDDFEPSPELHITTAWDHPQLGGPDSIISLSVSPYRERVHALYVRPDDAAFIAAARSDVPALCDAVDRLTAQRDEARRELAEESQSADDLQGEVDRLKEWQRRVCDALCPEGDDMMFSDVAPVRIAELRRFERERDEPRAGWCNLLCDLPANHEGPCSPADREESDG